MIFCDFCKEIFPPLIPTKNIVQKKKYGAMAQEMPPSGKLGPQAQKMREATEQSFRLANERAKLLDTPRLCRKSVSPSLENPIAEWPPTSVARAVKMLTVEDIVKGNHETDPEMKRQYEAYFYHRLLEPKVRIWTIHERPYRP